MFTKKINFQESTYTIPLGNFQYSCKSLYRISMVPVPLFAFGGILALKSRRNIIRNLESRIDKRLPIDKLYSH